VQEVWKWEVPQQAGGATFSATFSLTTMSDFALGLVAALASCFFFGTFGVVARPPRLRAQWCSARQSHPDQPCCALYGAQVGRQRPGVLS
jgi:hypothetical protein